MVLALRPVWFLLPSCGPAWGRTRWNPRAVKGLWYLASARALHSPTSSKPFHTLKPLASSSATSVDQVVSFTSHEVTLRRELEPDILRCCEPGERKRVAVLLSGGVDSSVSLRLLQAAGHACTAFYLKIWFQEDFRNFWSECPWEEDLEFAKAVCEQANVELRIVHLTNQYWARVVKHCVEEIKAGRTPNPDVLCNSRVKFGAFYDHIDFTEFDRVASGHYARVERKGGFARLALSPDEVKDQTYFLSHLSQEQLSRVVFPLGCLPKAQVRSLAAHFELPNRSRKDSQGICFLGKVKFSEFVAEHLGERPGWILEAESGKKLGVHRGFWFHTIGQRQGLGLSGGPWYVVAKDSALNTVFVSRSYYSEEKQRNAFRVGELNWVADEPREEDLQRLRCKVRHGPKFYDCSFEWEKTSSKLSSPSEGGDGEPRSCSDGQTEAAPGTSSSPGHSASAVVRLCGVDQGLAAGQFAAFYVNDYCVGSGVILEALGDVGVVPSEAALEAARTAGEVDPAAWAKVQEGPKGRRPREDVGSGLQILTRTDLARA